MSNKNIITMLTILLVVFVAGSAMAGAKLKVNDDGAYIDLGYRLQSYFQAFDNNLDPASSGYETDKGFKIRRARLRLKGVVNDKVSIFLQTDVASGGKNMQMIDAFVTYKADPWAQFYMGRNMAPSSRQATTTSGALMALDRPRATYMALNWGAGGATGGTNIPATADAVRDNGLTLFGSGDLGSGHLKYYAGAYNGVRADASVASNLHYTFRGQYNLWDAEGGYYNSSTYLGKKKTLGIGVSYDMQSEVGSTTGDTDPALVDYKLLSIDGFLELPSNGNALTVEGGYNKADYGDAVGFMMYQGNGIYGQAGYYLSSGFQPWFQFESFSSDAASTDAGTPGDFTQWRAGVTYFMAGQNANVKLAYETKKTDIPVDVGGSMEDSMKTITLGFFTTY